MRFSFIPLEERILLDAAGAAAVVNTYEAQHATDQAQDQAQQQQQQADHPGIGAGNNEAVDGRILVVSSQVNDSALLAGAAKDGVTVITYDFTTSLADLAQTISDQLNGNEATSIGFALMGADGKFSVTDDSLMMAQSLENSQDQQAFWSQIGGMVKNGGSIDILSCDVGINAEGLQLITQIDNLVDNISSDHFVSVNASSDKTGNIDQGANWTLEVGNVDALNRYFDSSKISDWDHVLDAPYRLTDISTGAGSSNPTGMVAFGDYVFYNATDPTTGSEGWFTNVKTGQTVQFADLKLGVQSSNPRDFTAFNGDLYFIANESGSNIPKVYTVDGDTLQYTWNSTLDTINTVHNIEFIGDKLYIATGTPPDSSIGWNSNQVLGDANKIYTYDGTTSKLIFDGSNYTSEKLPNAGTSAAVKSTNAYGIDGLELSGSTIYFSTTSIQNYYIVGGYVTSNEVWKMDTNTGVVTRVAQFAGQDLGGPSGTTSLSTIDKVTDLTVNGNYVYFAAQNQGSGTTGMELWRSDGVTTAMVKDIFPGTTGSNPQDLTVLDGKVYFTAETATAGRELWVTDGTSNGTVMLGEVFLGNAQNSQIDNLTTMGGKLYFTANDGVNGNELWVYNPTTNSMNMVSNINPGSSSSSPTSLTVIGDKIYFAATTATSGTELWVSDGTSAGTRQIADINAGTSSSNPGNFALVGSKLVFSATDSVNGRELWTFDLNNAPVGINRAYNGTEDITLNVNAANGVLNGASDPDGNTITAVLASGASKGVVTLNADGSFSYKPNLNTNGTDTFRYRIRDENGALSAMYTATITIAAVNDAPVSQNGTLSTAQGIYQFGQLVATDIDSGSRTYSIVSGPAYGTINLNTSTGAYTYTPVAGYFGTDSFTFRASDGTMQSNIAAVNISVHEVINPPQMLLDVNTGATPSDPSSYTQVGDKIFFIATIAGTGSELWVTDGTTEGTHMVKDIRTGTSGSAITDMVNLNGTLYFIGNATGSEATLWKSDGTSGGTVQVSTGINTAGNDTVANLVVMGSKLYFTATNGASGNELWTSDGTAAGTTLLKDINPGNKNSAITNLATDGTVLFFDPVDSSSSRSLWTSDGTAAGTVFVMSLTINSSVGKIGTTLPSLTVLDGVAYFSAFDTAGTGLELWRSDGTPEGTVFIKDIFEGTQTVTGIGFNSVPADFTEYNGLVYFTADSNADYMATRPWRDVWVTDGTPEGTINISNTEADGMKLASDLTSTYATRDQDFVIAGDKLYFKASSTALGVGYQVIDLTTGAKTWLSIDPTGSTTNVSSSPLVAYGDKVFFSATNGNTNGTELWVSDGTVAGTYMVMDINPGTAASNPTSLTVIGDKLYFTANDGIHGSETWVFESDMSPIAANSSPSTPEDTSFNGTLTGTDPDSPTLTYSIVTGPAHGTVIITDAATGTYTYTPDANYNGADSFTFNINDGDYDSNTATVNITITPVNDAPTGTNQAYVGVEDTTLTVNVANGVLNGANDIDGDSMTAVLSTGASKGVVTLNADGSFSYQPNANTNGTDTFTYRVRDQAGVFSPVYTATITIAAVDDAPAAQAAIVTTPEDTPVTGTLVATDVESPNLTYTIATQPANGIVTITNSTTGAYTYTPNLNYNGPDSFTFQASDGSMASTAVVTLNVTPVNDAPVSTGDSVTTLEDTSIGGTLQASDVDSPNLTYSIVTQPANGVVTITDAVTGTYTYTPNANYSGPDSFTFTANDGTTDSNISTISINVTSVNDAPVLLPSTVTTPEDTPYNGQVVWTDPDSSNFIVTVVQAPQHGAIVMNNDGTYTYSPAQDYNGPDSFSVVVNDGQADSNTQSISITVGPVDDAPVVNSPTLVTAEDTSLTILPSDVGTDVDSPTFTISIVTPPIHGQLISNPDGSVTYQPNADYNGPDSFRYILNDGTSDSASVGTVTLDVTPVNDAPVVLPSTVTTPEDTAYNGQVVWTDPDSSNFTVTVMEQPQHGDLVINNDGTYTYTPDTDYTGPDSFSVIVNDGQFDSNEQTIAITVGPVDDAPIVSSPTLVTAEDTPLTILPTTVGSDTDSPTFTINIVTPPANGQLISNPDGSVTYQPNQDYNGPDSFRYTLNDGTTDSASVGTVTLNVIAVNDVPIASSPTLAIAEDNPLSITPAELGTDVDGDPLSIIIVTQPANGVVSIQNGNVVYQPNAHYNGNDSFTYRVNDGSADSADGVVNLVVTPVNDAPSVISPTIGVQEDTPINITASQLGNDIEGDPLTINITIQPEHGTLEFESDGSLKYVPAENYNGPDSFSYTVNDGSATSEVGVVNLVVSPVNDAPTASNPTLTVNEDGSLPILPSQLGNDIEGNPLTITIVTPPTQGSLDVNDDGSVTYTPNENYNGNDSFSYTVNDGTADSDVGTVAIVVNAVNDAPIPISPTLGLPEDSSLNLTPDQLGSDVDGDSLTINIVTQPTHGSLTVNDNGSVTYTPNGNYNGNDSFTYTVNDGTTDSSLGTVNLIVAPVNDAPTVENPVVSLPQDTPITIPLDDLGSDIDGDHLTVTITNPPTHGAVTINDDGSVTYVPNPNYSGSDSFTYTVSDGTLTSGEGTANIIVNSTGTGVVNPPVDPGTGIFNPPGDTGGGTGSVPAPDGSPAHTDTLELGNPFASNFDTGLQNHNIKFLPFDLLNRDNTAIESNDSGKGALYQADEGIGVEPVLDVAIHGVDANDLKFKQFGDQDDGSAGNMIYQPDELAKLVFFLGPIANKAEYAAKERMGNPLKTRKKNMFRYREKRKIKKFSDLIEFLGLADLSYKRKSKHAVKTENLNTKQRGTLEKNLNPAEFGEEYLNNYVDELKALCSMEVSPGQFPVLEALAVELLTKYIAAQDLKEGFKIPFPTLTITGEQVPTEYVVEKVLTIGASEIPIYFLTAKNKPPILIFRGTKLGFKKISEVRSVIENFNSKGPARVHYNDFLPHLNSFFKEWFGKQANTKKFRIFGYSQGGVLGQRAIVDFADYVQTSDKYPSIFFNSPGVEDDYYKTWNARSGKTAPNVINYITTGDIVSKIGTGFIGEVYEINPEVERDILDSHFGVKFLEEDWKLFRVDADAETKSETRAMLNAIQASFLTSEIYKIASAGVERLFAARDKNFTASKAIAAIPTNVVIPSEAPPPSRYQPALENALLNREAMINTDVLSGHVSYINTDDSAIRASNDSVMANDLKLISAQKTDKARMKLIEAFAKSKPILSEEPEDTSMDYKREQIIERAGAPRKENLDVTFEPDLYSQADMSAAAIAVMEDIREFLPDSETDTGNKVLDAVKKERNIDHRNQ